jgi:hypothetical protein
MRAKFYTFLVCASFILGQVAAQWIDLLPNLQ